MSSYFLKLTVSTRPDRYVPLFGEYFYDSSKWRPSIPFVEQLKALQEVIDEGKVIKNSTKANQLFEDVTNTLYDLYMNALSFQVRYIGVSNETSYGVMEFVHAARVEGLSKIVSIQNSYSLLVRRFEGKTHPKSI